MSTQPFDPDKPTTDATDTGEPPPDEPVGKPAEADLEEGQPQTDPAAAKIRPIPRPVV